MKQCVYGGQYGSEGKGSLSEYLAKKVLAKTKSGRRLVVAGENSPNSGHTCSRGKTRNIPAASFWADVIILGPDSVIDPIALLEDLDAVRKSRTDEPFELIIHMHAAVMGDMCGVMERDSGVIDRISSTGSGSGAARYFKQFYRVEESCIGHTFNGQAEIDNFFKGHQVRIYNNWQFQQAVQMLEDDEWLFECSQGTLLDVNWGRFPYVTSRSTFPRVAIERNGLGQFDWEYTGVYRTYPIRTGGPSGPTGGKEITFESLGVASEIATVTKRIRRIFEFSLDDFLLSIRLTRPDNIAFTHLDYLHMKPEDHETFLRWFEGRGGNPPEHLACPLLLSNQLGEFYPV